MASFKSTTEDKISFMVKHGFEPLEPYKNALTKWKCKHLACGEIVSPRYNDIQQGKFTGFSESWIKSSFKIKSIREMMELVETDE